MACKCTRETTLKSVLGVSIVLLVCSIVIMIMFPSVYNSMLLKEVSLGENSLLTSIWEDIPLPIYEKLYFFNVTNGFNFTRNKEPLNVVQVGPYVYKAHWVKKHPKWNPNHTVSYREFRVYHFVPELSAGSQDDEIYTLNAPLLVATDIMKDWPWYEKLLASVLLGIEDETVIIKRSIRELTYEGYDDPIIKVGQLIIDLPFKDGKFRWLFDKNATYDGLFTVFTGEDDITKTNYINRWNGRDHLTYWKEGSCNMMNGTSIETGPPLKPDQETYSFFQSILCRSVTFNYSEEVEHLGIKGKRFRSTYEIFANSSENPDNVCFEVNGEKPSGVLAVGPCQFNAPAYLSFPHFHFADPVYRNLTTGLEPNASLHGSHVDVHFDTGLTIDASVKFQINLEIKNVEYFLQVEDLKEGIYPVLWVELSFQLDEDLANYLKSKLHNPKIIAYSVLGILCLGSCIAIIISSILLWRCKNDEEGTPLIKDDEVIKSIEKAIAVAENKNIQSTSSNPNYSSINNSDADEVAKAGEKS